jgi:hypothetical protein
MDERSALILLIVRGHLRSDVSPPWGLRIWRRSGRHTSFRIHVGSECGFFVKQGDGRDRLGAVRHEARLLARLERRPEIEPFLPRLVTHHEPEDVLVETLAQRSRDLRAALHPSKIPSLDVMVWLGESLSALHATAPSALGEEAILHPPPWVLLLSRPRPTLLRELSFGNHELIRLLQKDRHIEEGMRRLRRDWRQACPIHFDLRFENVVVEPADDGSSRGGSLVDWEFAGIGDPRWDVACVLAECLALWIQSTSGSSDRKGGADPATAARPLVAFRDPLRGFWRRYLSRYGPPNDFLDGCIGFCAARLIQLAYEMTQGSGRLTMHAALMLQSASNLLASPPEMARQLLGLDAK